MRYLIWSRPDGGVTITTLADLRKEGESWDMLADGEALKLAAAQVPIRDSRGNIIGSRLKREGWQHVYNAEAWEIPTIDGNAVALTNGKALPGLLDDFTIPGTSRLCHRRNCWTWAILSQKIVVRIPECRTAYMAALRAERDNRLEQSDRDKIRLDDIGTPEQIAAHKAYRQALRDLPAVVQADLSALTTAEQIDQYQPTWPVAE